LRTQLLLPTALGVLLPAGVKGALCAVLLMGVVSGMASQLHGFSGGIIQDVILPFSKRRLEPAAHIRLLRIAAMSVALFGVVFSLFFRVPDFLVMVMQLFSAIYLAGVGAVVWGGLYWRRATTQGAWAAMVAGSTLAVIGTLLQQFWPALAPWVAGCGWCDPQLASWLRAHAARFPVNGQIISACIMGVCAVLFVSVSLLTCRAPYDLDRLLHRGAYRLPEEHKVDVQRGFTLKRLAGVNENFTRGDRLIAYFTFWWGLTPNIINLGVVFWNIFVSRWSPGMWWSWHRFWAVDLALVGGVITTVWFTWGVGRDMLRLFHDLRLAHQDVNDDGQVHDNKVA
jgi:SSS family solute:Na+ symporter